MKKQTHLLGVVLFVYFFLSCKHQEKKGERDHKPSGIKENFIPFVYGIDISHHQNNEIDYISKTLDSLSFVICKATEGVTYTDPLFSKNWKTIKARGFIRGAYHFYRSDDDPIAQVQLVDNIEALRTVAVKITKKNPKFTALL
jgi:lysozyme